MTASGNQHEAGYLPQGDRVALRLVVPEELSQADEYVPADLVEAAPMAIAGITPDASLETILAAWSDATLRLQQTHETLQGEVARLTNELEAKNQELARQQRLADLGRMAGHVAHEVRNSLVPVTLYLSLLRRRLAADTESSDILTKVEAGFTALDTTVNDLLNFTSHREPDWRTFLVRDLVDEVCQSLAPQMEAQGIATSIDIPPEVTLSADREMFRRALLNLALNSIDVMDAGGELVVTSFDGPQGFELEVADSGPGFTKEQLSQLFEPFFTTKSTGTGLGLSIVQRIVTAHGGHITAMNCPEGGAAFTIQLPRQSMRAAA
ncbi:sensor histidine kinase [Adhaeretor mobilis]|uniref:histidine kinase n=1 Tax=Adhaeretor mobilis TaxID=1930276 RepID=A0A517MYU4_9BACT|nr:ATP-binding protein [Adhaeretor mobilis]QDT00059.1 Sensor protein ZraS [Adhaeretor mobilis]